MAYIRSMILITEENRNFLKYNKFTNDESFSRCINRLIEQEKKRQQRQQKQNNKKELMIHD